MYAGKKPKKRKPSRKVPETSLNILGRDVLQLLRKKYPREQCIILEDGKPAAYMQLIIDNTISKDEVYVIREGKQVKKK